MILIFLSMSLSGGIFCILKYLNDISKILSCSAVYLITIRMVDKIVNKFKINDKIHDKNYLQRTNQVFQIRLEWLSIRAHPNYRCFSRSFVSFLLHYRLFLSIYELLFQNTLHIYLTMILQTNLSICFSKFVYAVASQQDDSVKLPIITSTSTCDYSDINSDGYNILSKSSILGLRNIHIVS